MRFTGNRSRAELLIDIGLGKRIAIIVAKRLVSLLAEEKGEKPDALLLTRERFTADPSSKQGVVTLDGSEDASVHYSTCCRPIPGDPIVGYLGRGEGLVVHTADCPVAAKLQNRTASASSRWNGPTNRRARSRPRSWSRSSTARACWPGWPHALAAAEADITHIDMGQEAAQDASDLRFVIAVRDRAHLDVALRNLRRTASVLRVQRI